MDTTLKPYLLHERRWDDNKGCAVLVRGLREIDCHGRDHLHCLAQTHLVAKSVSTSQVNAIRYKRTLEYRLYAGFHTLGPPSYMSSVHIDNGIMQHTKQPQLFGVEASALRVLEGGLAY